MSILDFPKRTIHLDFHTGPQVNDVGSNFDPEKFAAVFKEAHVDSVTVFAMCHHGHLYYDTEHPARHPGLRKGLDLTGEQIRALHKAGIRAPIYISVQCNEYAANEHPDWIALTPDLKQVKGGSSAFTPAWQIIDMSSPYQDYLAGILQEVLEKYAPVDGVFMDMCWDQPSCSKWAVQGMLGKGLDPGKAEERARYARELALSYMQRYKDIIDEAQQKSGRFAGVWFNSRPKTNLHVEKKFLRHVEIEALPTGGWGYAYFPYVARFVRPLGLPTLSHTGRFFKSWGDNTSLKPEMALKYECCQILSQGMTEGVGDLLHPRGVPSKAVYELIGKVYKYIESCEPYTEGAKILSQIALIMDPALGDKPGYPGMGAVRALQQLRQQFDVLTPDGDVSAYELVIIPESTVINEKLKARLSDYLRNGGALIVCGKAALNEQGEPVMEEMGITVYGESPFSHTFMHAEPSVSKGLAEYGYVMYDRGFRMKPGGRQTQPGYKDDCCVNAGAANTGASNAGGTNTNSLRQAEILVRVGEPYFERDYTHFSGHDYTPEDKVSEYAAAVKCGNVITFSVPILEAYGKHASPNYRILLGNCIDLLLPRPLIRDDGPSKLETTVMKTKEGMVVHLLSFCPERRCDSLDIVEDPVPLVDMPLSVKTGVKPKRVFLAPVERELPFEYGEDGYIRTKVTVLDGHAMLVLET